MALGAARRQIVGMVLMQAGMLVLLDRGHLGFLGLSSVAVKRQPVKEQQEQPERVAERI